MKLELIRTYFPDETKGDLLYNGEKICSTIELARKRNSQDSCIPEGKYQLRLAYSRRFARHFILMNVPHRNDILIRVSWVGVRTLNGSITPLLESDPPGWPRWPRLALVGLVRLLHPELMNGESVFLIIKSNTVMNTIIQRMQQPTPGFFQKIRNIGLVLGAIGAAIVSVPIALPALLVKIAGYLTVAGAVAGAVSQAAVTNDK